MTKKTYKPKRPSNFNVPTFSKSCPSCGATVEFASIGSTMSVCEYCQTTLVREGDDIVSQGKQSLVIEDYSPLQLGSCGTYGKHSFVIIGRIQLQYSAGIWNEWYIQLDNGTNGWLSEDEGQYTLTRSFGEYPNVPSYHELSVGQSVKVFADKEAFTVTDRRSATALAGEGELPFVMNTGWQTWVIDARHQRQFVTLDYGEKGPDAPPVVFRGAAVTLEQLNMQLLKDERQRSQSISGAKSDEETLSTLGCPNCGSPINYVAGATDCLICPACCSEVGLTGKTAEVVKHNSTMQLRTTSLSLGDKARIAENDIAVVSQLTSENLATGYQTKETHHDYVVIGIMQLQEVGEYARWTEYLLYSFSNGFLWLEEEPSGWRVARVLNELPVDKGSYLQYRQQKWHKRFDEDYQSRTVYAIGAFNWRVDVGDTMTLTDYKSGVHTLIKEQNNKEVTYTISSPLTIAKVNQWFGKELKKPKPTVTSSSSSFNDDDDIEDIVESFSEQPLFVKIFIIIFVILFVTIFIIGDDSSSGYIFSNSRGGFTSSGSHK